MNKLFRNFTLLLLVLACSVSFSVTGKAEEMFDDYFYYDIFFEHESAASRLIMAVNSPIAYLSYGYDWYGYGVFLAENNDAVRPVLLNDYIYIPAGFITESFNASSEWLQESETTVIMYNNNTIKLMPKAEPQTMYVNGNKLALRAPATILNDRIYLTARDLCEAMGLEVYSKDGVIVVGTGKQTFDSAEDEELFVKQWKMDLKYISQPMYASDEEARKDMAQVKINVWTLNSSGAKVPATRTLSVNKEIADEVAEIFQKIYESPEQFPIKDIGGYSWRGAESTSSHKWGLAIDINSNENYYVTRVEDGEDKIMAGSLWLPLENPYSIAPDSDIVKIFQEYGWFWAGNGWGDTYDYMHFSWTGR